MLNFSRKSRSTQGAARTPKQRAGAAAEDAACAYLQQHGCRVLARNARYRDGELDIVATEGDCVLFVEVRLRSSANFGGAAASVTAVKQGRIARAARRYLVEHYGNRMPACRFDVITADNNGVTEWIRNAFELSETY